ncbi:MAG: hypothetical protein WC654_04500 [Patescibacteria group bacterium]
MPACKQCASAFEVTKDDLAFYEKVSPVFGGKKELIPPPEFCPDCRLQRRLLHRNDLCLYHRKSDLTGKAMISIYAQSKPYKVYDQDEWWSDQWDELAYGRAFDFSRTFAEQFQELSLTVPHQGLFTTNAENSYYTNHSLNTRNCYLIAGATNLEDCLFGRFIISGHDVVDGLSLYGCEWCYEGIASQHCYHCMFFRHCRDCSDCIMVDDCQSCRNCCMCFGLRSKQYCYLNEQCSKEEYERRLQAHLPLTTEGIGHMREKLTAFSVTLPHRALHVFGSEDCTGDMVFNSRRCENCYDCTDCEDCKHVGNTPKGISTHDANYTAPDGLECCYNVGSTVGVQRAMGTFLLWYGSDVYYSRECHHCSNLFGCISMRHKKYCILNKQYTEEEYEKLVSTIIAHMRSTGEWGDYLRPEVSTMGYNETLAQEYFPLTREQVLAQGWKWHDEADPQNQYLGAPYEIPDDIRSVPDDIVKQILRCSVTGKPYKIIPQELKFYRDMGIPLPRRCFDRRHLDRVALRSPRKLWKRNCAKCGQGMETTYSPERLEIVYCENCYLKEVY